MKNEDLDHIEDVHWFNKALVQERRINARFDFHQLLPGREP